MSVSRRVGVVAVLLLVGLGPVQVPLARARAMLVEAYVQEAIALIGRAPVREAFGAVAADWLSRHVAGAEE